MVNKFMKRKFKQWPSRISQISTKWTITSYCTWYICFVSKV